MKKLFLSVLSFITALGAGLIILIEDRRAQDGKISWFDYSKNKSIHLWQLLLQFVYSFFWSHNHPPTTTQKTTHHKESNTTAPAKQKPKQNKKIYFPAIINSAKKPTTIAAISYINAPCVQQILSGFAGQLYKDFGEYYQLKHYCAQENNPKMQNILDHLIRNPHALIFSIGTVTTGCLKKLTDTKKIQTPVVFTGVKDLSEIKITKPEEFFTGVLSLPRNHLEQVDFLNIAKPTMRRVVICYKPYSSRIINDAKKFKAILEKNSNLDQVLCKEYTCYESFEENVLKIINRNKIDTVVTMRDILPTKMLDQVVSLCNQQQTTIYASDAASLSRGVSLAYGNSEYQFGINAGMQAFDILHNQIPLLNIPITQLDPGNRLWVNPATLARQGIPNSHALLGHA